MLCAYRESSLVRSFSTPTLLPSFSPLTGAQPTGQSEDPSVPVLLLPTVSLTGMPPPAPPPIKLLHFRLSFGVLSLEDLRTTIRCDPVKWYRDTPNMRYARSHTHSWREAAHGGPRSPSPTKSAPVTTHEWFKIGPGGSVYMTEINKLHKSRLRCSPRAQVVPCRLAHYLPQSCNI